MASSRRYYLNARAVYKQATGRKFNSDKGLLNYTVQQVVALSDPGGDSLVEEQKDLFPHSALISFVHREPLTGIAGQDDDPYLPLKP